MYILRRLDEFSTWIAIIGACLAIYFLPKGLLLFAIVGTAIVLTVLPDSKFSTIVKKIRGWIK